MRKYSTKQARLDFVRDNMDQMSDEQLCRELDVIPITLHRYKVKIRKRLGTYSNPEAERAKVRHGFIKANRDRMNNTEMAKALGVTLKRIAADLTQINRAEAKPERQRGKVTPFAQPVYSPFQPLRASVLKDNYGGNF